MRIAIIVGVIVIALAGAVFLLAQTRSRKPTQPFIESPFQSPSSLTPESAFESEIKPTETQPQTANITASFTIRTDNITRSFRDEKYHNQSKDVFIIAQNPNAVHVIKNGITWSDFFATLPMKLTKECLITGDGETLCDGQQGTLQLYLNGIEDEDLLDREIKNIDTVLILFTSN